MNDLLLPVVALLAGIGVAAGIATAPAETLNGAIDRSGLAALIPAAAAPVGATGRTLLALVAGGLVALLGVASRWRHRLPRARLSLPTVRRADAHPDAPPRRPIRASEDLGLPLAAIAARGPAACDERPLPKDLDLPLSAFDPAALPERPLEPVRPVAPLAKRPALIDAGERFETFSLAPPAAAPAPSPALSIVPPSPEQSIAHLLERLERLAAHRIRPAPEPEAPASVDETLQRLRRLATG